MTSRTTSEINTQPELWRRAAEMAGNVPLPQPGERVAVVGCGTSWFIAHSYAVLREQAGHGWTDAFAASEFPYGRQYDRILVLTRSGTTTEVLELLDKVSVPTIAVTGTPGSPVVDAADQIVMLDFADEESVVQTRFATTTLALLRTSLGEDISKAISDAETALTAELDEELVGAEQFSFLGTGWSVGIATEAGLKMREAAIAWTESYPAMEYRHGPISIAAPGRVTWVFGQAPEGLAKQVAATGARFEDQPLDPMADLVRVQRLAVAIAERKGLNPDTPRNLTRSVILSESE